MGNYGTRRLIMSQPRQSPIVCCDEGLYEVTLLDAERALIAKLMAELAELVEDDSQADMLTRLFPTALPNDPEAEAEFQDMVRRELIATRIERFKNTTNTAQEGVLNREQLEDWMGAVNDVRLVLGTQLDISQQEDIEELDADDPNAMAQSAYWFFGWLLEHIVATLANEP